MNKVHLLSCSNDCMNDKALRRFLEEGDKAGYSFEAVSAKTINLLRGEANEKCLSELNRREEEKPTPEAWEDFRRRMREIRLQLDQKCTQVFGPRDGILWYNDRICALDRQLKKVVKNGRNVLAWHVMCGSTTSYEDTPLLDLPKPYSVEDLINTLLSELEKMKKGKSAGL